MGEGVENRAVGAPPRLDEANRIAADAGTGRGGFVAGAVGLAAVVVCLGFAAWTFDGLADPVLLAAWLGLMAVAPLAFLIGAFAAWVRPPNDADYVARWLPAGRFFRIVLEIGVMISPWILLPNAGPGLRALMFLLYIWFIAFDVLANDDPQGRTLPACIGIPASLALFLLTNGADYAWPLSIFLALIGGSLFFLRKQISRDRDRGPEPRAALAVATGAAADGNLAPPADGAAMPRNGLTPRQIEVLRHLAQGKSNKDIARALDVSPATIKTHVAQIIAITGAANRTGATMHARSLGLI